MEVDGFPMFTSAGIADGVNCRNIGVVGMATWNRGSSGKVENLECRRQKRETRFFKLIGFPVGVDDQL